MTASADPATTHHHWLESTVVLVLAFVLLFAGLLHSPSLVLASTNNSAGDVDDFHVYVQFNRRCEWRPRMEFCYWVKTAPRSSHGAKRTRQLIDWGDCAHEAK